MQRNNNSNNMQLTQEQIAQLTAQGCMAEDWTKVDVSEGFDASRVTNTAFYGNIQLGANEGTIEITKGFVKPCGIHNATLREVSIGNNCLVERVNGYINNYWIGDDCYISNVYSIETSDDATFGEGSVIPVLNEVGDGNVMLFDGLSSQLAAIMVKYEQDKEFTTAIRSVIKNYIEERRKLTSCGTINPNVHIINTDKIKNCHIGRNCRIEGAQILEECTLKSAPEAPVKIGSGVICENCVVYNGSTISNNAKLEGCFVGEACKICDGFTAENSLFFANNYMSNGEACAAFCGPFSASHHKCSLLIGAELSFYNAGSNTNFSNHAYKMGPMHYGTLERGTKTASGSYILLPAKIGTFSVCMGKLMHHPDTRNLPFSYLIAYGEDMYIVPGRNLTTVGLYRDIRKWPKRDKRPAGAKSSIVNFDWLSPFSVGRIMTAKRTLESLLAVGGKQENYLYHDYIIKASSLKKGIKYYDIALRIYMGAVMKRHKLSAPTTKIGEGDWSDLSGLLIPETEEKRIIDAIKNGTLNDVPSMREELCKVNENYNEFRWAWSYNLIREYYGIEGEITEAHAQKIEEDYITARRAWIAEIRKDAEKEFELGDVTPETLNDFLQSLDKEVEVEKLKYYL